MSTSNCQAHVSNWRATLMSWSDGNKTGVPVASDVALCYHTFHSVSRLKKDQAGSNITRNRSSDSGCRRGETNEQGFYVFSVCLVGFLFLVIVVANGQTERFSELPTPEFKLDF